MGEDSPEDKKLSRLRYKCNICGRRFLSEQALESHQTVLHSKLRQLLASPSNAKAVNKRSLLISNQPTPVEKSLDTKKEIDGNGATKVLFKCPKCSHTFPTSFHAIKHMQKNYCTNSRGRSVTLNSSDPMQPVRTEICLSCKLPYDKMKHLCPAKDDYVNHAKSGLRCLACEKYFPNMKLYDFHISTIHSSDVVTMFFNTLPEFIMWKQRMESQTQASYVLMSDFDLTQRIPPRNIYRCPYYCTKLNGYAGFCPSSIIIQEYPKGYQIHFAKEHYMHNTRPYQLEEEFKKYTINYFVSQM